MFLLSKSKDYHYSADAIAETGYDGKKRNKRSVWPVNTEPYPEAHFATFPPSLVAPCVLAGSEPNDLILDPFFGSGTVGLICQSLGRRYVGIELKEEYAELALRRLRKDSLLCPPPKRLICRV